MTIAVSIQVNDGLILAADSASTILSRDPNTGNSGVVNVYDNANKVFNLHKKLPVGAITWGAGSIGTASTYTLVKDFRKELTDSSDFDLKAYTVEDIAHRFYDFIYTKRYLKEFEQWPEKPALGFIIGGYSSGAELCEHWQIEIPSSGVCNGPALLGGQDQSGIITWNGIEEPLYRVIRGFSSMLPNVLRQAGLDEPTVARIMEIAEINMSAPLVFTAMPIQDAIDLAQFLIDYTAKFIKYTPGPPTVGGPIEIAAITKHEGFKWIKRKYYFDRKLNPEE